jgi:hypothetical protein
MKHSKQEIYNLEQLLINSVSSFKFQVSQKIVAIGEIGLDKHEYQQTKYKDYQVDDEFFKLQKVFFIEQLKLAIKYKKAVIIHDSVFIKRLIDFDAIDNQVLWHFNNKICTLEKEETDLLKQCGHSDLLLDIYNKRKWRGCFGSMSVISYDFVYNMNETFQISNLLQFVYSREHRMCLERVIGVIFYFYNKKPSVFGDILKYQNWGYSYEEYLYDKKNGNITLSIIKVWTGR